MPEYPREGGFLPDQEEFDFNLPTERIFLVVRTVWGKGGSHKFVVARDGDHAIKLAAGETPHEDDHVSFAAADWNDLVARGQRFNDDWKNLTRRN